MHTDFLLNSSPEELYLQKLKQFGYSNSGPRRVVFETLLHSDHEPLMMSELVTKIQSKADRASIYRAIKILEKIGVVKRINIGWKYKLELSDDFHGHHHHITCVKCGKTQVTENDENFEQVLKEFADLNGYRLTDHQLDFRGLCTKCQ